MHTYLIIGNIFSFLSAVCIAVSVIKKNKNDLIWWQIIDVIFCILSNIALYTYAAMTTNSVALIRNILAYKNKLTKNLTWILCVLCVVVGLWANNRGIIGLFPIIASASYTIFMFITENEQQMRWALVSNLILWLVHDIYVQAYPSAVTDLVLSVWTAVQIWKYGLTKDGFGSIIKGKRAVEEIVPPNRKEER
ncbi:MAG: YgjV family protein [Alphaproteobacteria bacterium]|nr:YgjV family protein [Alphaproteobacteria bacterium]